MDSTQATKPETAVIDSGVIDNRLMFHHSQWILSELKTAQEHLIKGLAKRNTLEGELHFSLCSGIISKLLGKHG